MNIRHNCLLTKFPLLFVIKTNGIYCKDPFLSQIPRLIAEHGYEVQILELADINAENVTQFINEQKQDFHLLIEGTNPLPSASSVDLLDTLLDHVILLAERDYIDDRHQIRTTDYTKDFNSIS